LSQIPGKRLDSGVQNVEPKEGDNEDIARPAKTMFAAIPGANKKGKKKKTDLLNSTDLLLD
jgi:hypothetical protein